MRARIIIASTGLLCLLLGEWAKADLYNDGGIHDILSGSYDRIDVDNPAPPGPAYTTVNLGGTAQANSIETYKNSQLTINGGMINQGFSAHDKSRVTMNEGIVWGMSDVPTCAYDNSQLTINGGRIYWSDLYAYDNSQLTINDGRFGVMSIHTYGNSQTVMNGGRSQGNFFAYDNSQVSVAFGAGIQEILGAYNNTQLSVSGYAQEIEAHGNTQLTFNGATRWLNAYDNTRVAINGGVITGHVVANDNVRLTMNGGSVSELAVVGNNRVTVNGGEISGYLVVTGNNRVIMSGDYLEGQVWGWGESEITLIGSDFAVYRDHDRTDFVFSGYGDLDSSFDTCWLFGTLATGDRPLINLQLRISDDSEISLVAAPLPGAALLGALGLGIAGWRLRRRTY